MAKKKEGKDRKVEKESKKQLANKEIKIGSALFILGIAVGLVFASSFLNKSSGLVVLKSNELTPVEASEKARKSPALFGSKMIGLRIPASMQAIELVKRAGGALVGTSANLSGNPPPRSVDEIEEAIIRAADLVIDGGRCPIGKPSTVIKISGKVIEVIREGALTISQIKPVAEEVGLSLKV